MERNVLMQQAIAKMRKEGYLLNFKLHSKCLECRELKQQYPIESMEVHYRMTFWDSAPNGLPKMIFAVQLANESKGLVREAYGMSSVI